MIRRRASAVVSRIPRGLSDESSTLTSTDAYHDVFQDADLIRKVKEEENLVKEQEEAIERLGNFIKEAEKDIERMESLLEDKRNEILEQMSYFEETLLSSSDKLGTLRRVSAKMEKQVNKLSVLYNQNFLNSNLEGNYGTEISRFMSVLHKRHHSKLQDISAIISKAERQVYESPTYGASLRASMKNQNILIMSSETSLLLLLFLSLWALYFVYVSSDVLLV